MRLDEIGAAYASLVHRKNSLLIALRQVDAEFKQLWEDVLAPPPEPEMAGSDLPARDVGMNSVRLSDVATEVIDRDGYWPHR